jgi:hypothetical protein
VSPDLVQSPAEKRYRVVGYASGGGPRLRPEARVRTTPSHCFGNVCHKAYRFRGAPALRFNLQAIRDRLNNIGTAATTAAEALDGNAIDLPEGTLAGILSELVSLDGRLDLALDRLAGALDPAPSCGK